MLGHRLRRWANIEPTLRQYIVLGDVRGLYKCITDNQITEYQVKQVIPNWMRCTPCYLSQQNIKLDRIQKMGDGDMVVNTTACHASVQGSLPALL